MIDKSWVIIGRIAAPHGIKGEVKITLETVFPERFNTGNKITLIDKKGIYQEYKINSSRPHKEMVIVKLEGVNDRTQAELMRGLEAVISEEEVGKLPSDSYFIFELIGMKMVTDEGKEVGTITQVLQGGASDIYVTDTEVLVPAIKEFIVDVDKLKRIVTIHTIPGLIPED
jgi:16S rRNA processing protein RimM